MKIVRQKKMIKKEMRKRLEMEEIIRKKTGKRSSKTEERQLGNVRYSKTKAEVRHSQARIHKTVKKCEVE